MAWTSIYDWDWVWVCSVVDAIYNIIDYILYIIDYRITKFLVFSIILFIV